MITIILNHHNKYAEVEMPAMYEELQLALWKLGLDQVPEKYTLQDLEATFRYQSPLEYFVLRLLEGEMNLLDAVSAIYIVGRKARKKVVWTYRRRAISCVMIRLVFSSNASCSSGVRSSVRSRPGSLVGTDGKREFFISASVLAEKKFLMQMKDTKTIMTAATIAASARNDSAAYALLYCQGKKIVKE